jgi:osmoprotectant transport system permease protein
VARLSCWPGEAITSVRTATVYVVAPATLATLAGGGGLGDIIVNEPTYGTAGVIAGSITITLLAFSVDGVLALRTIST